MSKVLVLPPGASDAPVSHGKEAFPAYREDHTNPGSRWLVEVHDAAAHNFLHNGGFQLYDAAPMRRRLSGQYVPLVFGDGQEPSALSYDGDSYASELQELPDGSMKYILAFPAEGVAEVVSIHPAYHVLSLVDHQPPAVHPGKGYEKMERDRRLDGHPPLQGGGFRELDIFPANSKPAQHPDGVENPAREAEIRAAEAEAAPVAETASKE